MNKPKFTIATDAFISDIPEDAFSHINLDTALQNKELKQMESAHYQSKKRYFVDDYFEEDWR